MWHDRLKIRFSLRLLFIGLSLCCIGVWWYWVRPRQLDERQRSSGRALIHGRDRIYLEFCFDQTVKDHLVTVLGDSRLTHWNSVQWISCPDAETVISFGQDNALLVWNRDDGSIRQGFYDTSCAAYAHDRNQVFWADSSQRLNVSQLASSKGKSKTPTKPTVLTVPQTRSPWLMCTADGEYLIHTGIDVPVSIWSPKSAQPLATIERDKAAWPLTCSPDRRGVLVVDLTKIVEYELPTGRIRATVAIPALADGHRAHVNEAVFSPVGETLYLGDAAGRVLVFDWNRKEFREVFLSNETSIQGLVAGKDFLFVASDGLSRLHWYGSPRQLFRMPLLTERVHEVASGPSVAAAMQDGRIVILDGDRPRRLQGGARSDATCFAFSPSSNCTLGKRLSSASN